MGPSWNWQKEKKERKKERRKEKGEENLNVALRSLVSTCWIYFPYFFQLNYQLLPQWILLLLLHQISFSFLNSFQLIIILIINEISKSTQNHKTFVKGWKIKASHQSQKSYVQNPKHLKFETSLEEKWELSNEIEPFSLSLALRFELSSSGLLVGKKEMEVLTKILSFFLSFHFLVVLFESWSLN